MRALSEKKLVRCRRGDVQKTKEVRPGGGTLLVYANRKKEGFPARRKSNDTNGPSITGGEGTAVVSLPGSGRRERRDAGIHRGQGAHTRLGRSQKHASLLASPEKKGTCASIKTRGLMLAERSPRPKESRIAQGSSGAHWRKRSVAQRVRVRTQNVGGQQTPARPGPGKRRPTSKRAREDLLGGLPRPEETTPSATGPQASKEKREKGIGAQSVVPMRGHLPMV